MGTRMRNVAVAAMVSVGLAACAGGAATDAGSARSGTPSTVAVPPTTSAPTGASLVGGTDPPPSTTSRASRRTTGGPTGVSGADTGPKSSSVHQGYPVIVGTRMGGHPGYTRYVFDFVNADPEGHSPLGSARPGWDVRYVPLAEAVQDGSGDPPPVGGAVYLRIRFDGAAAHYDDGTPSISYGVDAHAPLGFGGDFEGHVTWFMGMDHEQPFRVSFVENNKVVVDLVDAL